VKPGAAAARPRSPAAGRPVVDRWLASALLAGLGLGCAGRHEADVREADVREAEVHKMTKQAPVEISYAGDTPGKPTLLRMQLDVVLRNQEREPRWFLLPKSNQARSGGVDVVQTFELTGKGRAVVGRFLGGAGFQAVLLAPGTEVRLHKLPLSYWGERPRDAMPLEVIIAGDFAVGGEPARSWFASDPETADGVDVSEDQARAIGRKETPDGKEAPVSFTGEQRIQVEVKM
jgi:hypothetical protein